MRVDWNPNGERNTKKPRQEQIKRISWDEATDIIALEIKRITQKYGPMQYCCKLTDMPKAK